MEFSQKILEDTCDKNVCAFIGEMDFPSPHTELKFDLYVIDNTLKPYEE